MSVLARPRWSCQRLFDRPPQLAQPTGQNRVRHIKFSCPFTHCQSVTAKFEYSVITSVVRLFDIGGPPAIFRRIAEIIVDALDGMFGSRTWPHILKEVFKAIQPPRAHRDPSRAIIFVVRCVRVVASGLNACPDYILGRFPKAMRTSHRADHLIVKTSATSSISADKRRPSDHAMVATVTSAKPSRLLESVDTNKAKYSKTAKLLARQVLDLLLGDRDYRWKIIADNCKKWELWGMILHVDKLLSAIGLIRGRCLDAAR
jgi:hypothetical protein